MRNLHKLEPFAAESVFHVVVESPRGANVKLKYSPEVGAMSISRPLVLGAAEIDSPPSLQLSTQVN